MQYKSLGRRLVWGPVLILLLCLTVWIGSTCAWFSDPSGLLCIDVSAAAPALPPEEALKNALQGKKLSILGDSISTYTGWSNSVRVNDTLGSNTVWYDSPYLLSSVDQTWWKQAADKYGMEILVNNSWSGSSVTNKLALFGPSSYGYNTRPQNLHDNTLSNNPGGEPILPDIIAVYMGANDLMEGVAVGTTHLDDAFFAAVEAGEVFQPENFEQSCALMIFKIRQAYPDAQVFCFNNPKMSIGTYANRKDYNAVFQAVAQRYGCHIVGLYDTPLSSYDSYTIDGVHPNAAGMDIMTETFAASLRQVYLPS